jgi:hypothetical protein
VIPRHSLIVTTRHEITRDKTSHEEGEFLAGLNVVNLINIENLVHQTRSEFKGFGGKNWSFCGGFRCQDIIAIEAET